ncbi:MAG TPA: xanthine dehydrogenase family protein subunit M [Candidatus Baltobacteraceae bacterium]|nr:xanthine dehydrogenase family protein subunit M [Candidatus Baltobacteraceae bacterium]
MIPAEFEYARPRDVGEALRILSERAGDAKVLSGGYSLLPLLKLRLASPSLVVDIGHVAGLDGIAEQDGELRIGARVTHARLAADASIAARYPVVHEAAGGIGDPQVRNWGTIGGSCAHADPSSDWPAVLIATRASLLCRSVNGDRTIAARDFFVDAFQTAIEPDELLVEIRIPTPAPGTASAYKKLERRAGDFATVGVAVQLHLGADGRIDQAGVGLTAVAETPFAATDAEAVLIGAAPGADVFKRAAAAAAAQSRPAEDRHGPVDYKRAMVAEMTGRALTAAAARLHPTA